jgi:DNA (cytosine-5)-methyltransferase 1
MTAAGVTVVGAVEKDEDAAASYAANHPDVTFFARDIRYLSGAEMRRALGVRRGALTILTACPPCQGWSSLGSGDPEDVRNDLVLTVSRFVRAFLPQALILENVPGLRRDPRLPVLRQRLERAGYRLRTYAVDASEFGVPQVRRRLIILGFRGRHRRRFPVRLPVVRSKPTTVGAALAALQASLQKDDALHQWRQPSPIVLRRIRAIPRGGRRFDLPPGLQLPCHEALEQRVATASYGRLVLGAPAPTMTTRCTTVSCGRFIHPTANRGLSLREAATLQSFPPTYRFHGGHDSIERQIGNAVPVRMAEEIARVVLRVLDRRRRA